MGLDMYAYTAPAELVGDQQVDVNSLLFKNGEAVPGVDTRFAYWRKFNNLHGWMHRLYQEKGGTDDQFNCATLRLMPDDLDRLLAEARTLEPTSGFFFGSEDVMTEEDVAEVVDFIVRAREAMSQGKAVIYDSWW